MQHTISDIEYQALLIKIKHLEAENESLKQLLQEYQHIAMLKEREQTALQQLASTGIEIRSSLENQAVEIQSHKNYINELLQKTEAVIQRGNELEKQAAGSVTIACQLEKIQTQYDHLQAQLNDLSERLLQLNNQNMLQLQYAGRIAELESLLANAEDELSEMKNNISDD